MFAVSFVFFILFTLGYGFASAAVIYHLRQYTLSEYPAPRRAASLFIFLSILLWLFALLFLFNIPS